MTGRLAAILAFAAILAVAGCTPRGPRAGTGPGSAVVATTATAPEVLALERQLAAVEQQIGRLEGALGRGRGTYRDGAMLRVEGRGGGGEAPLDRLRRLERELADAEARLAARDARIAEATRELQAAREQERSLGERAGDLAYAKEALVTAQQALAEARSDCDGLRAQLAASELQRLKAEREQYRIAAALLRLAPGQASQLLELQDEARAAARALDGHAEKAR